MSLDSKARITQGQVTVLCTFFEENPEVICGYKKTPKLKSVVQSKWRKITPQLNALGTSRGQKAWAKYLCNIKGKLKKKKVKWKHINGSEALMCNTDEFSEIELRMFQVLKNNSSKSQDIADHNTSDMDLDDSKSDNEQEENNTQFDDVKSVYQEEKNILEDSQSKEVYIKLPDETPPPESHSSQIIFINSSEDSEFDTFGKNIAQQLKMLPLAVALETQEILISVLRKQRIKILNKQNNVAST